MRIVIPFILSVFFLSFTSGDQIKFSKRNVREGIKIKIPENFYKMPNKDILERYRSYKLPIAMYSSEDRLMELGISISDNFWSGNDLELLMEFQKSNIMALYDKVKITKEGIRKVHKYDMAYFEIETDTRYARTFEKKYSLLHYAVVDNRVIVFNFSCPVGRKDEWSEHAWKIMDSIKMAKKVF